MALLHERHVDSPVEIRIPVARVAVSFGPGIRVQTCWLVRALAHELASLIDVYMEGHPAPVR